ncbi:phage tail protein [Elizabethkingia ursingii]|uniref:phage tail protein n=1 Tax=Elizabethkingia ursingii TaxID=1756150 RepID=UPI002013249A|nr:phage tail protein [Elizabethkingia ursingii]MCL1671695.1 phage tail protein [Elizabethkingia ursingii]
MEQIVINQKNGNNIELFSRKPFISMTSFVLNKQVNFEDFIDIDVDSSIPLNLFLEDKITFRGKDYFLNLMPQVKKLADDRFTYNLRFEGVAYLLRKLKLFNLDSQGFKTGVEFPMTSDIPAFLYLIINNANKWETKWELGEFPTDTEAKTITFNNENCLAALQRICQEFDQEFDIEQRNSKYILHIRKVSRTLPYVFEYGKGNGLYDLNRSRVNDSEVVSILYGYGSSQNIPANYREYSQRLRMPVAVGDYITSQAAIDLFGRVEDVITMDDIKPTFKGAISSVGSLEKGVQSFSVSNMDFDLKEKNPDGSTKYLIAGTPAKISFTKGDLAGYDFEIVDYDHSTKTFKIKQIADEKGLKFPDTSTIFSFKVGDEFTLIDIMMPEQYITNAENKLHEKVLKKHQQVCQNNVKYALNIDPLFMRDKVKADIGDYASIKDESFGVDKITRIIGLKYDLFQDKYDLDIADIYEVSLVKEIKNDLKDIKTDIKFEKIENRQQTLNSYRMTKELRESLFDVDGFLYTDVIRPISIRTLLFETGDDSQQLGYSGIEFVPNVAGNANQIKITAGVLTHYLINPSGPTDWNMLELNQTIPDNDKYYIYARCQKNGPDGTFLITKQRITYNSEENYYNFLIAMLHSVDSNNLRYITMLEGMTSIQGGYIKTKKLSATNGRAWFDFDMATFELGGTAGMTGNGSGDDAFLWSGKAYTDRNIAPTRISHNGKLNATDAYLSGEINASKGKIGDFTIQNGSMRVGDAWTLNSSFAYISPEQTIYRTLFGDTENMRDIRFGQTVSSSSGTYGAVCYIINWEKDSVRDNIGLQLDVKNGAVNTALDILNGGIQVKGQRGFTGLIYNDKDIIVQDGIIVGYR